MAVFGRHFAKRPHLALYRAMAYRRLNTRANDSESKMPATRLRIDGLYTKVGGPFSLRVAAGECIGLRGASGAGKSLFLRAIADLDPHRGEVSLDGVAAAEIPAPLWRRRVALLPAEGQWWSDVVGEHFVGEENPYLQPLGFAPEVYAWQVSRLSTGEKQRLALARLLEKGPEALLLDEPTASLDPKNTLAVERVVRAYLEAHGATALWVSHDEEQAERVGDRRFILEASGLEEAVRR